MHIWKKSSLNSKINFEKKIKKKKIVKQYSWQSAASP